MNNLDLFRQDFVLSIKPAYATKIVEGSKKVELRRRFPLGVATGARVYVYATVPLQAVIGYATILDVERMAVPTIWSIYHSVAFIERGDFDDYYHDVDVGSVLVLGDPVRLDAAIGVERLRSELNFTPPQSFTYADDAFRRLKDFARPPRSSIIKALRRAKVRCETGGLLVSLVGYARVSTDGQSLDAQLAELAGAGAARVFSEKASGSVRERPALGRAMDALADGDVLVVTRLDRLARSTRDLLNLLAVLGERGAGFRSLRDTWADTTTSHGRLMVTVLGGLAEFERDLILSRTSEGRSRARARGVRLGRKPKLTPHQRREALARRAAGEPLAEIARSYAVHHTTIGRLV